MTRFSAIGLTAACCFCHAAVARGESLRDARSSGGAAWPPRVDRPLELGVDLEAHGGILTLVAQGEARSRAVGGGTLRGRYSYFQIGGRYEQSDSGTAVALRRPQEETFAAYSGFVGVTLPFYRWVDVDATVGMAWRTYENPSKRFGPQGFSHDTRSVTWFLGMSDRAGEHLVGARIGAGLFGYVDVQRTTFSWDSTYPTVNGPATVVTRTRPLGGTAFGLSLTCALELGGRVTS